MLLTVLLGLLVLVLLCLATVHFHDFFFSSVFLWLCECGAVELYFVSFFQADFANEERP